MLSRRMLEREDDKEERMMAYKKRHSSSNAESSDSSRVSDPRSLQEIGMHGSSSSQSIQEAGSVVSFGSDPV